jgi:hypothetical protein
MCDEETERPFFLKEAMKQASKSPDSMGPYERSYAAFLEGCEVHVVYVDDEVRIEESRSGKTETSFARKYVPISSGGKVVWIDSEKTALYFPVTRD